MSGVLTVGICMTISRYDDTYISCTVSVSTTYRRRYSVTSDILSRALVVVGRCSHGRGRSSLHTRAVIRRRSR